MTPRSVVRRTISLFLGTAFVFPLLTVRATAQPQPGGLQQMDIETAQGYKARDGEALVIISVFMENGKNRLDRQSVIKMTNETTKVDLWQTTDDHSQAGVGLVFGKYSIEVSAVGYLSETKEVQANNTLMTTRLQFYLKRDPNAVDLNVSDETVPQKARGDLKHGLAALKSSNFKDAQKNLEAAYKLAPTNPDINYLLGYLAYQQKDLAHAKTYLETAASESSHSTRVSMLLGQVEIALEDYPAAAATLENVVNADSDNWMAHNLLATSYLKVKNYEGARKQAELAVAKGNMAANTANLILGQALVNLGKKDEGVRALKTFVQNSPNDPTAPQVRDLITMLEQPEASATASGVLIKRVSAPVIDPIFATPELPVTVNPWRPAGVDEAKPSVADGVTCPLDNVIAMSGERVKQLVDDVSRISAIEHLLHQQVDEMGNSMSKETRTYDYMASISEDKKGFLAVDEDRLERMARASFPDRIASGGFATLALVFHPDMRENFDMTCEGLGKSEGQATWLVRFKQREDRPALISEYNVGGQIYSLRLKGRAWITADKFEIVRIESELIAPIPQIQLRCEQQVVEYGPVRLNKEDLWLPKKAEIYLDYRKHRYVRSHSYDHYLLFSVDSVDKTNAPKAEAPKPTEPTEHSGKPLPN
jgi:tetratricopeptide (TPR) repeat protein